MESVRFHFLFGKIYGVYLISWCVAFVDFA